MNKLKSYVLFGAFLLVVGVSDFSAYGDDNYPATDRQEMGVEDNSCDYMQILTPGKRGIGLSYMKTAISNPVMRRLPIMWKLQDILVRG